MIGRQKESKTWTEWIEDCWERGEENFDYLPRRETWKIKKVGGSKYLFFLKKEMYIKLKLTNYIVMIKIGRVSHTIYQQKFCKKM